MCELMSKIHLYGQERKGDLGGDEEVHHVIDVLASSILLFLVSVPGWAGEREGGGCSVGGQPTFLRLADSFVI